MTAAVALLALLVVILWVILVATSGELRAARIQAESVQRSLRSGQRQAPAAEPIIGAGSVSYQRGPLPASSQTAQQLLQSSDD